MSTPILKVISEYCNIYVDDINLEKLAVEDMPLYARRIWGYFKAVKDMNCFAVE